MDQTEQQLATLRSYGGADSTAPSFVRPQYVRYNTFQKSRDFGPVDNLDAILSGEIGGSLGAPTLFFRVETERQCRLGIVKNPINRFVDATLSVGIVDSKRDAIQIGDDGFAQAAASYGSDPAIGQLLDPGEYFFLVSSSRWQAQPFEVFITVISYRNMAGSAGGALDLVGRLAMAKFTGAAGGTMVLTLVPTTQFKPLEGAAGGLIDLVGTTAGLRGDAGGSLDLTGRFKTFWRVTGTADGTAPLVGTLTSNSPYGGY